MAHWLYEAGIGENRAALIQEGEIVEAVIELPGALRAGSVADARLVMLGERAGVVRLDSGEEASIEPLPPRVTEGAALRVEIVREAMHEPGRLKLPKARATDKPAATGPTLLQRIGDARRCDPRVDDRLETAGWSELIEEARSGAIPFAGGALRMSVTPAMTLFDVDGSLPPAELAIAGAAAAARAIRRHSITGSIGIDLPTLAARAERAAAAAAFDAVMPQPYERTAVNGFGFLQIVRRRQRASIPELILADPVGAAARALLRRAEKLAGSVRLAAAAAVIRRLEQEAAWLQELGRRTGGEVALSVDPALSIWASHAQRA
jgi:hypothetical protein